MTRTTPTSGPTASIPAHYSRRNRCAFASMEPGTWLAATASMKDLLDRPVAVYMSRPVETVAPSTKIEDVARAMHARGISGLPVLDGETLVGVVTRTDLIQLGALQTGRRWTSPAMPLPRRLAKDVMTKQPRTIAETAPLRAAAKLMSDHAIHRVFVMADDRMTGVISTVDIAAAVADARIETPLSAVMTSPIVTLDVHAPLSAGIDLLSRVMISGLIVIEHGRPVGVFTQLDALASRDLPRSTPIETTMDAGVSW